MAGPMKFAPPCGCCACPQTLCVSIRCRYGVPWYQYSGVAGVEVLVRDQTDTTTIASCTTDASGGCCFSIVAGVPVTYLVKWSKGGYTSGQANVTFDSCLYTRSVTGEICRGQMTGTWTVYGAGCPIVGASVAVTGDITGSGTTAADGTVSMVFDRPADCFDEMSYTATITPPGGSGLATLVADYTRRWDGCGATFTHGILEMQADASHVLWGWPVTIPKTISVSSSDGSFTATWDGASAYVGYVDKSSSQSMSPQTCGIIVDP